MPAVGLLLLLRLSGGGAFAQTPSAKKPSSPEKSLDDLDSLRKGDSPTGTLFRFVDAADPKQSLAPRRFWRLFPVNAPKTMVLAASTSAVAASGRRA